MTVLALLLENLGIDMAIRLGDPADWRKAVAELGDSSKGETRSPANLDHAQSRTQIRYIRPALCPRHTAGRLGGLFVIQVTSPLFVIGRFFSGIKISALSEPLRDTISLLSSKNFRE